MNANRRNDTQIEVVEQIQDLAVQSAEQVKGGFNPQPEPPKAFIPPFRPPPITPMGVVR